uniref:LAGLIDADG homing endonuclease n=1 Tax=Leontynka pallida TaxID=2912034 RepID=UPI0020292459|nr:LAGLIDADG homing endonuclease [Leontynka pallida]UPQ43849.1 LAGLIDADG homing endonuclease [Leontynka pallida]
MRKKRIILYMCTQHLKKKNQAIGIAAASSTQEVSSADLSLDEKWNDWFAGMTDGDGCFYINKKDKSISFEVTTHTTDIRILRDIKNKIKMGSVKMRSGSESMRYRVKASEAIREIVKRLNGRLHNSVRLQQFSRVCELLGIKQIPSPVIVSPQNAYLAGLLDSDGCITINVSSCSQEDSQLSGVAGKIVRLKNSRGNNQLMAKVTLSDQANMLLLKNSYGFGSIYADNSYPKATKTKYNWYIRSLTDFNTLYELLKKYPLKGVKMHRMRLTPLYFKYKELKYHLAKPDTLEYKIWENFCKSWFKYHTQ